MRELRLDGASENNLREIDVRIPLGLWTAVTGPSGSGKTSLVFDLLVREGQRRFLGSLSPKARQYMGKLGRARLRHLNSLPVAVAVGASDVRSGSRSTVGTLSGVLDLLRLLFARAGSCPGVEQLTRSHFSFNHPLGACLGCEGSGVLDSVDPDLLVADPKRSLLDGALVPTLKNGYTVYSQVTVPVMQRICEAHGFSMDQAWEGLSDDQRNVILYGTRKLKVPFGKHSIESRMRWEGITARPREEGYYRGLIPVIEETLQRSRNPGVLRFVRSVACPECAATRLGRIGREATVAGRSLPEFLALSTREFVKDLECLPESPVVDVVRPGLEMRLKRMIQLGLGHLSMDRSASGLSTGESQRLALATQLTSGLGGLLIALDEPTVGLHPSEQAGMGEVLEELCGLGNTLVVVEHDPDMVRWADHLLELGPGAGVRGGRLEYAGALPPDPLGKTRPPKTRRREGSGELVLRGARTHGLQGADLLLGLGCLNVVLGPSGAGKSSLVFGTLLPALEGQPALYDSLTGAPAGGVGAADARPIGRNVRSTPATWTGLFDRVRKRLAASDVARAAGLKAGDFSYNSGSGRCPACEGLGVERIGLHLLEDLERVCATCAGARFGPRVEGVRLCGLNVAEILALDVDQAVAAFAGEPELLNIVQAMQDLGLGYLHLGQPSNRLSRGEAQRIKLATLLSDPRAKPSVLLLDEPDRGLHPSDVDQLIVSLERMLDAGHTVVAISHHRSLWAAADRWTAVDGGRSRRLNGPPQHLPVPARESTRVPQLPRAIEMQGVRTHNLKGIDVSIPHGQVTVICGVSGSGKSSLAFDTLATEAWSRFAESLPFHVRRFVRRQPRPKLESALGLLPVISLRQGQGDPGPRASVASLSGLGSLLRLLWSRASTIDGEPVQGSSERFSADHALGACAACEGLGEVERCDSALLISHPHLALPAGAMQATRVGRYLGEAEGQFMATLRAALDSEQLGEWLAQPFDQWASQAQAIALEGSGEQSYAVTWSFARGGRTGEHRFEGPWQGLLALAEQEAGRRTKQKAAAEWAAALSRVPCESCAGERLGPDARRAYIGEWTLPSLLGRPANEVAQALDATSLDVRTKSVVDALWPEVAARCKDLDALGVGHLALGRLASSLSMGELQRVRLASVLHSGLTATTVVLDEPAAGLHGSDVERLMGVLNRLVQAGNTVVVVEHRPDVLRAADHWIELGPGAGAAGGELLAAGPRGEMLAGTGPTARALRSLSLIHI